MGFLERWRGQKPLIVDGATGTWLHAAGLPAGTLPEQWNAEQPQTIVAMHRAYVDAGAEVVLSNSFGASRRKLSRGQFGDRAEEFNRAAVALARQAADGQAFVGGDIGPIGELMAPMGPLTGEDARATFAEQARWLADAGADFVLIETMSDLDEAAAAVEGAVSATTLPVICSMSFDSHGRTMMGVRPKQMAERLLPLGVAGLGVNCGRSLEENAAALQELHEAAPDLPLWVKPNAGLPRFEGGRTVYDVGPEAFAQAVLGMLELGARAVGGCCGTTPAHIQALREALARC
ncbi:MAG: methionine synthase [Chloroflexi bacterium]|nr:methionine synthase [Chloroflexota bacterium]